MKLRKKKGRVYDTVKYVQAKASKVKQSHIIQYIVITNLKKRIKGLRKVFPKAHFHWVLEIKISPSKHN